MIRATGLYILGYGAALVAAKGFLSQLEGVNLGETVSIWVLPPFILILLFCPLEKFARWGGGAALITVILAEAYERFYHFFSGKWIPEGLSICLFWGTTVVVVLMTVNKAKNKKLK